MLIKRSLLALGMVALSAAGQPDLAAQGAVITVPLTYHAPGTGPKPNFSPKGTQVTLAEVPAGQALPPGAVRPAKRGLLQVGPARGSWIPVLATASAAHPADLNQLFVDRNRNGNFGDDGPAAVAVPTQNAKTKAWWSSFNAIELRVAFPEPERTEPYFVNFWVVREDAAPAPDVIRYSRGSWRSGTVTVNGVPALVAAMDGNNDALYGPGDSWSVIPATAKDATAAVLSIKEARDTSRLMFLERSGAKDLVLEFKSFKKDGSAIEFTVVDRPVTKAEDRLPDDMLADERPRPRTKAAFAWSHDFDSAVKQARASGKRVFIDFETTWCGPCKTMDEWIWNDAEVAAALNAGYVGLKLDGDIEKAHVKRFGVTGYPTMVVFDPAKDTIVKKVSGYQSSAQVLTFIK
ncbi:MAG TPA: thioredoxin family protein [Vicinamibacterales bacterium]|jgi:thiol-disulfide isomerase/thioredoxin|nr:thioredoxin family protein [Acidobacteriota bacterium]HQX82964.1 thioredoxin family protein [Vicinamibacterales bacterium]